MKVITPSEARQMKDQIGKPRKRRRRGKSRHPERPLTAAELATASPDRRARLSNQGTRGHKAGPLLPAGHPYSVQLDRCGHRARVEVLSTGRIPVRARCPKCRRWQHTLPDTARKPVPSATRTVVDEREEDRDGQVFKVTVLGTPRRARF